ncbi:MAG TPA: dual specificity protein phosphatase [Phycisphaerae bacterium]|nr:dual specificity protein phosphatase [Phycisphaerae bacterium]
MNSLRKLRREVFSWAAIVLQLLQSGYRRVTARRVEELQDYTEIEPRLFLGGRCKHPPPDVRAVLCVTPSRDDFSVEFYQWRPAPTGAVPTMAWVREQVEFIDEHMKADHGVFVHCDAGMDRSATVVVAYLMWRDGLGRDRAIEVLQRKRAIRPNPAFMQMLAVWEGSMRDSKPS